MKEEKIKEIIENSKLIEVSKSGKTYIVKDINFKDFKNLFSLHNYKVEYAVEDETEGYALTAENKKFIWWVSKEFFEQNYEKKMELVCEDIEPIIYSYTVIMNSGDRTEISYETYEMIKSLIYVEQPKEFIIFSNIDGKETYHTYSKNINYIEIKQIEF